MAGWKSDPGNIEGLRNACAYYRGYGHPGHSPFPAEEVAVNYTVENQQAAAGSS